jgi:hypothetical protein
VQLVWSTVSEKNNFGFEIEKAPDATQHYVLIDKSFVSGNGTTLVPHTYSFVDRQTTAGRWWYRLKQLDLDGTANHSHAVSVEVGAATGGSLVPVAFGLLQNFPNPFNPTTTIRYSLTKLSLVRLEIINLLGERVKELVTETQGPGTYDVTLDATRLSSGTYFCRLQAGEMLQIKKILILK